MCFINNSSLRQVQPISRVATRSTPVPRILGINTSPRLTGRLTRSALTSFIASKIIPFGIGPCVLTETVSRYSPASSTTRAVEVSVRVGFVTSASPYWAPRGQEFPTTVPASESTTREQPRGHTMQVKLVTLIFTPSRYGARGRRSILFHITSATVLCFPKIDALDVQAGLGHVFVDEFRE